MLTALLLLLLAPAEAGKRSTPSPAATAVAEPVPPSADVLRQPSPFIVRGPALVGSMQTLDITSMQRTTRFFEMTLDDLGLGALTTAELTALRRMLAADPGWRLAGSPGQLVATARGRQGAAWITSASGYLDQAGTLSRLTVRFGPWPAADPWATSALVARASASTRKVKLSPITLQEAPWAGRVATALSVEGAGIGFDIFDAAPTDDRSFTTESWLQVADLLNQVRVGADLIVERGTDGMLLPAGEPGAAGGLVLRSPGPGLLELQARANPGAEGWTWLRLMTGGRAWEEAGVAAGTREVLGYSGNPAQGFYMEAVFPVPAGAATPATAELWFLPLDGAGTPRRLSAVELVIPAR